MNDWQSWLTIAICLTAAVYIARRAWHAVTGKKTPGCGSGCGTCPSNAPPGAKQIVSIEPPRRSD